MGSEVVEASAGAEASTEARGSAIGSAIGLKENEITSYGEEAAFLASSLSLSLDIPADRARILEYYLPVLGWVTRLAKQHKASGKAGPLVIGLSAPQGCGKTTIVESLSLLLPRQGINSVAVSIDDFYLTRAEQVALGKANADNPLLQVRGNAGTHDLALGANTIEGLKRLRAGETMGLPRYDKSAHGGKGDRFPEEEWPVVEGPVDVVLFEGWMLGFEKITVDATDRIESRMESINELLPRYQEQWHSLVNAWMVVRIEDAGCVFNWRLQAEHAMRAAGKPGMSDEAVRDFVAQYMPAYEAYLPALYASRGPKGAEETLFIDVDAKRNPVGSQHFVNDKEEEV